MDYLLGRQNVVDAPAAELNAKFAAIATAFDEIWLNADGTHPLQVLWQRKDALSTNELLNFGDAVERFQREAPEWLNGQIQAMKTGDSGQTAGAIFEIMALNFFSPTDCCVIPAPEAMPGFDGTLVLKDNSRVLVSVKNHGMSNRERDFMIEAAKIDDEFKAQLLANGFSDGEINVLAKTPMNTASFQQLKSDIPSCLADVKAGKHRNDLDRPYTIVIKDLESQFGPLSSFALSSSCRIMAPVAPNEQANFNDAIRKGCSNLYKHTKDQGNDACRLIILRLSNTASIAKCHDWARWYFNEYPDDPIDVILLYQCAVTTDDASDTSSITHHVSVIRGAKFADWQAGSGKNSRRLPGMSFLVGNVSHEQPILRLTDGVRSMDMSNFYVYQRADLYKKVEFSDGASANLSNPAPGIMVHAILEQNGVPVGTISSKSDRDKQLTLLP